MLETLEHVHDFPAVDIPRSHDLEQAARLILRGVAEDPARDGLVRTPQRFQKALLELTAGYHGEPSDVVGEGVFPAEGTGLVTVRNVEFYSLCEHHLLPFWGTLSVAYFPDRKILGLSKIPRLVDLYARRFQVQERLTRQVAEAVQSVLAPRAVAVRAEARHLCMMMRGVEKQHSDTVTEFQLGLDCLSETETSRLFDTLKEDRR